MTVCLYDMYISNTRARVMDLSANKDKYSLILIAGKLHTIDYRITMNYNKLPTVQF